jgi:deoxyribonuclease IV
MLNIYFLFLIKDKIHNNKLWNKYLKNKNNYKILIHPKKKENIIYLSKNEIVLDPLKTKWGDISIADAEVYLLKEALKRCKGTDNYFILLSGDTIPIDTYINLYNFLEKQDLSFFNYKDYMIGNRKYKNIYYYSSQFFCVNYKDALVVTNNYKKYRNKFLNIKMYSPDEIFMLSILFYNNRMYKFIDMKFVNTTFFYYIRTIPEIEEFIQHKKKLKKYLYILKEDGKINSDQNKTLKLIIKFEKYGMLHPYTFLFNKKLIKSFKNKFPNSFFLRKIIDKKENNVLDYNNLILLKKYSITKNITGLNKILDEFLKGLHNNDIYIGSHIDISNGLVEASKELYKYGGNVIQIIKRKISKNIFSNENIYKFNYFNSINKIKVFIHSNYTINLANEWDEHSWWIKDLINEFELASKIFAEGIVVHCGKKLNLSLEKAYNNMFSSIIYILNKTEKYNDIYFIIETSSGQGSETLTDLNNLSKFIYKFINTKYDKRIKICIDTCHVFTAGYDIRTKKGVDKFLKIFDKLIGLDRVALIHLNDSKEDLNSHKDRHESIGQGKIGRVGLNYFKNYFYKKNISIILETPNKSYKKEIKSLLN